MRMSSFAKVLTATDVGSNGSHQGGPLIPSSVSGVLPQPVTSMTATAAIDVQIDVSRNGRSLGTTEASVVAHSRNLSRNDETHLTGLLPVARPKAGDVMVVTRTGRRRYSVDIVSRSRAKAVKARLGGQRYGYMS